MELWTRDTALTVIYSHSSSPSPSLETDPAACSMVVVVSGLNNSSFHFDSDSANAVTVPRKIGANYNADNPLKQETLGGETRSLAISKKIAIHISTQPSYLTAAQT